MKKLTTQEFINNCKKIHGDKYDYSNTKYLTSNDKITIICPKHGEFQQTAYHHIGGHGCKGCMGESIAEKAKISLEEFITRGNKLHNNYYDYSLVEMKRMKDKIKIICPKHGTFEQTPDSHLHGSGCRKCGIINKASNQKLTSQEFIDNANKVHFNKYDYSLVEYKNTKEKVKIICQKHGIFLQNYNNHVGNKRQCPKCTRSSRKELEICDYFTRNNIPFEYQPKFNSCRNPKTKRRFIFDFYLKEYNLIVEYDGQQHYKSVDHWGGNDALIKTKEHDLLKTNWCLEQNINLLRIKYDEDVFIKLSDTLSQLRKDLLSSSHDSNS